MPPKRSPERDQAFEIYKEHSGNIANREIAKRLDIPEKSISGWKAKDKWDDLLIGVLQTNDRSTPIKQKRPGAPPGNQNAKGNRGGAGGPPANDKAVKHGLFAKYLPEETLEIMQEIETKSPIDMLWDNIVIQYTAIIRAQRIMLVRDKDDQTKVLKREKRTDTGWEDEYELQHAWDKQANFLQAQSRAMTTLQSMIIKYEDLCRLGKADEEQKLRIEKLKAEVDKLREPDDKDKPIEILIRRKGDAK